MRTTTRAAFAAASALALALTMSACSSDEASDTAATATSAAGSAGQDATSAAGTATDGDSTGGDAAEESGEQIVELVDGWVKATDGEMAGVFGTLRNTGSEDVQLTGVTGELGAIQELHETVPGGSGMTMREKEDGFVIPAGGELVLEPGGNHIMLMELDEPITTGQEVTLTLEFDGGATQDVTFSARSFHGGEEEYVGEHGGDDATGGHGGDGSEHGDDHGGMNHDG